MCCVTAIRPYFDWPVPKKSYWKQINTRHSSVANHMWNAMHIPLCMWCSLFPPLLSSWMKPLIGAVVLHLQVFHCPYFYCTFSTIAWTCPHPHHKHPAGPLCVQPVHRIRCPTLVGPQIHNVHALSSGPPIVLNNIIRLSRVSRPWLKKHRTVMQFTRVLLLHVPVQACGTWKICYHKQCMQTEKQHILHFCVCVLPTRTTIIMTRSFLAPLYFLFLLKYARTSTRTPDKKHNKAVGVSVGTRPMACYDAVCVFPYRKLVVLLSVCCGQQESFELFPEIWAV